MQTAKRVKQYITSWRSKGYPEDIQDEVPHILMKLGLAPSYKAICLALLNNDTNLTALGFSGKVSKWYSAFKKVEIEERERKLAELSKV